MSLEFLNIFNKKNKGPFHDWLITLKQDPQIAWYPCAGSDFRDLIFLSHQYANHYPSQIVEPPKPNLFIHTDYFNWGEMDWENNILYQDKRTTIEVLQYEEIASLPIVLDPIIISNPEPHRYSGKVLFYILRIHSNIYGVWEKPLIYFFLDNAWFCANLALPNHARFSHIIHVRYAGGFGGGNTSGAWIHPLFNRLHCQIFINDRQYPEIENDRYVQREFHHFHFLDNYVFMGNPPIENEGMNDYNFEVTRTIDGDKWSKVETIYWEKLIY